MTETTSTLRPDTYRRRLSALRVLWVDAQSRARIGPVPMRGAFRYCAEQLERLMDDTVAEIRRATRPEGGEP